jgi:signal transduction histidine kinase
MNLLVVDADRSRIAQVCKALGSCNAGAIAVRQAHTLTKALELLRQDEVDLVLMHPDLPDCGPWESVRRVGELRTDVPVVVLTDPQEEELGLRAIRAGALACHPRHQLSPQTLGETLKRAMEQHQTRMDLEGEARELFAKEPTFGRIIQDHVDGMMVVDDQGLIRFVNAAAEKLVGCRSAHLMGQRLGLPVVVRGEAAELDLSRDDGRGQIVVEMRSTEICWNGSSAYLITLRDVTSRARLEEAQQELIELKDDFVSNVSHQLRTPLHSLKGFLSLLRRNRCPDPEIAKEFLDRAAAAADRLAIMVDELLEVSRMESGGLHLQMRSMDLAAVAEGVIWSSTDRAQAKEISLCSSVTGTPPVICGDPHWVQQALSNLVENAIKFSERGSTVRVCIAGAPSGVTVRVTDQGPGIPAAVLPKLFDKFYQAESAAKRAGEGSGLGLYIVKGIIEAHGGAVGVDSSEGKGSTFFFTLPSASQESPPREPAPRACRETGEGK